MSHKPTPTPYLSLHLLRSSLTGSTPNSLWNRTDSSILVGLVVGCSGRSSKLHSPAHSGQLCPYPELWMLSFGPLTLRVCLSVCVHLYAKYWQSEKIAASFYYCEKYAKIGLARSRTRTQAPQLANQQYFEPLLVIDVNNRRGEEEKAEGVD